MADRTTTRTIPSSFGDMFDNLNHYGTTLEYLEGKSPGDLQALIKKVRLPTRILTIYFDGTNHVAWMVTEAKFNRKGK